MSTQYTAAIQQLYVAYFGRPADTLGLQFWEKAVAASNGSTAAISAQFSTSAEYTSTFNGLSSLQIINQIYTNLFGRPAELEGLTFWAGKLENKEASISTIIGNIVAAASTNDKHIYENKGLAAKAFSEAIDTPEEVLAYNGQSLGVIKGFVASVTDDASLAAATTGPALDALTAQVVQAGGNSTLSNVNLTTGLDNLTANQFFASETIFNTDGKGPTLNAGDRLTGTAGRTDNVLTITDLTPTATNGVIPAGVTLKNIQTVTLNTTNNTAASGFSVLPYADVKNVNIVTNGNNADVVIGGNGANGAPAQDVSLTHNSTIGGAVTALGGSKVTVVQNANAAVLVGVNAAGTVPAVANVASGSINVTTNSTGAGNVSVVGGSDVTVSSSSVSFTGSINVGNTIDNLGGGLSNTAGAVTVNNAGSASNTTVFGGSTVTINAAGGNNTVGDNDASLASNQATGAVTITNTAQAAYDGLTISNGLPHSTTLRTETVYGGTDVSITTNTSNVVVGTNTVAATLPKGTVTVKSTANDAQNAALTNGGVTVFGGTAVDVTVADANVTIGGTVGFNPTGAVKVTETRSSTQQDLAGAGNHTISIDGGNGVTVTALGQNVTIGANQGTAGAQVVTQTGILTGAGLGANNGSVTVDGGSTVSVTTTGGAVVVGAGATAGAAQNATGAVTVTNKFGAGNAGSDAVTVVGGAAVTVSYNNANKGTVLVGDTTNYDAGTLLNASGTALKAAFANPTGNVVISSAQTNGTTTTYGTGAVKVVTNGATSVSITGDKPSYVVDAQSTLATGGVNAGKAIGTSTLATVVFDGVRTGGTIDIKSDALANLSVLDNATAGNIFNVVNNTAGHTLNLTTGNNTNSARPVTVIDANATTVNITDNGKASTAATVLQAAKATTLNVNTTAAATLNLTADTALTKIVAANKAGSLALGNVAGLGSLATIDATTSTGTVSATINQAVTSFNGLGGTGNQTITITGNSLLHADGTTFSNLVGGSGTNTLVANYAAQSTDGALGNNSHIKGFSTLGLGALASSSVTHAAYVAASAATAQVRTFTVNGGAAVATETYTVTLNGGATLTYTAAGGETVAQIAANLAGQLVGQGNVGYTIGYTAGSASFTVTGPAAGTPFTLTAGGTAATAPTSALVTLGGTSVTGDNFYDASGFSALTVGATAGDVTFKGVGADVGLTVTASQSGANIVNYLLNNAAGVSDNFNLTMSTGSNAATSTILTTGVENLKLTSAGSNLNSAGSAAVANAVTIGDTAAKTITVSGAKDITVTLKTDANGALAAAASNVITIDASASTGAVNVNGVALKDNATHTITGGAGLLTATGGANVNDVDSFTTGTGGGNITLGTGGKWVAVAGAGNNGAYSSGSETINLAASAGKTDTLNVADGAVATFNGSKGGVNGFVMGVKNADALNFTATDVKTIIANVTSPVVVGTVTNAQNNALSIDKTGALFTALGNLTYTVSNGVITFGATAGHQISDFTSGQLVSAAELIVNAAGIDSIAAFTYAGDTYVVSTDHTGALTVGNGAAGTHTNLDAIVDLVAAGTVAGFGSTGAAGTIVANVNTRVSAAVNGGTATAQVYDDTGFAQDTLGAGGRLAFNTTNAATLASQQSYTFNKLAASAVVGVDLSGVTGTHHIGDIVTTQTAAAGSNSLTVNLTANASTAYVDTLTIAGDATLKLNGAAGAGTAIVSSLVDSTNSLTSLSITGTSNVEVDRISSTSLTSIAITDTGTATLAGGSSSIGINGLAVTEGTGTLIVGGGWGGTLTGGLSGTNNVITVGSLTALNNNVNKIFTSGSGASISIVGAGDNLITATGAGTTIAVGNTNGNVGANVISATGSNANITFNGTQVGNATATVGSNAIVTFGTTTGAATETITITGAVTGGTSASYAYTTLNNVVSATGDKVVFNFAGTESNIGLVNVSSATTLAQALDLAIAQAALSSDKNPNSATYAKLAANTGVIDWFQFNGDTYIVEAVNASGAAVSNATLDANDVVVKITGLVDLTGLALAGHTVTL